MPFHEYLDEGYAGQLSHSTARKVECLLTNSTIRTDVTLPVLALLSTKYILVNENFRKDRHPRPLSNNN